MAERKVPDVINQETIRREASGVLADGEFSLTDLWIQILDVTLLELQSP